ncbi:MAG: DUF456 domain-containing protein [Planctomycetota bacterium]
MSELFQIIGSSLGYLLLYLVMMAGPPLIILGLPGQFIIVIAALIAWVATGGEVISLAVVILLLGIGILAEVLEGLAGFLGAGRAEGSLWSCIGAVVGGILGAVAGSMALPIIGSIIGVLAGTFAGAYIVEYGRTRTLETARHVATGALIGRILGSAAKIACALIMITIVTIYLL